jgi:hypothetical protein
MNTKSLFAVAAVVGLGVSVTAAEAQVCAGFPTVQGQTSVALSSHFPSQADRFGAEVSANPAGPLAVFGGYQRTTSNTTEGENANTYTAGVALEVSDRFRGPLSLGLGLSACPVASASLTQMQGADVWQVPLGVGFGSRLELDPTGRLEIMPYAVPQLVWTRVNFDGTPSDGIFRPIFGGPETLENYESTDLGIRTGVMVGAGRFFVGGEFENVFDDGVGGTFGVKAGLRF